MHSRKGLLSHPGPIMFIYPNLTQNQFVQVDSGLCATRNEFAWKSILIQWDQTQNSAENFPNILLFIFSSQVACSVFTKTERNVEVFLGVLLLLFKVTDVDRIMKKLECVLSISIEKGLWIFEVLKR